MGRRRWCTDEQQVFLDSKRVLFLRCRELKVLPKFWKDVHKEYFSRWPIPEPTPDALDAVDDDAKEKKRVSHSYFRLQSSFNRAYTTRWN